MLKNLYHELDEILENIVQETILSESNISLWTMSWNSEFTNKNKQISKNITLKQNNCIIDILQSIAEIFNSFFKNGPKETILSESNILLWTMS